MSSSPTPPNPLIELLKQLNEWISNARRRWPASQDGPDDPSIPLGAVDSLEGLRAPAKDIIVWLELNGRDEDAAEIDDALSALRGVAEAYDEGELLPKRDPIIEETVDAREQLIDAAKVSSGRLEDLLESIPEGVWRGFDDA